MPGASRALPLLPSLAMASSESECEVLFMPSGRRVRVEGETSLLEATQRAGLPIATACGEGGICARCGLRILAGAETLAPEDEAERRIKARNRIPAELRLACRVKTWGQLTVTADYW